MQTLQISSLNLTAGFPEEETYKFSNIGDRYAFNDHRGSYEVAGRELIYHKDNDELWSLRVLLKPDSPERPVLVIESPAGPFDDMAVYLKIGDLVIGYSNRTHVVSQKIFQRNTATKLVHVIIIISPEQPQEQ